MTAPQDCACPLTRNLGLIGTVLVVGLVTMPAELYPGDPYAMREEARALLRGRISVEPEIAGGFGARGQYFVEQGGRFYSKYGIMNSVMSVPPLLLERMVTGALPPLTSPVRLFLLNVYNVMLSVLVAAFLYRTAGLFTRVETARITYLFAVLYGTFLWNYLRAQTGEIFQVIFFLGFYGRFSRFARGWLGNAAEPSMRPTVDLFVCWAWLAALVLTRVAYLPLAVLPFGFAAFVSLQTRRDAQQRKVPWIALVAPAIGIVLVLGVVHWIKFGSAWLSGYHQWRPEWHSFSGNGLYGVRGFLLHPQRSILVHFPVLVLGLWGTRRFFKEFPIDACATLAIALTYLIIIGKLPSWAGENSYGPRYLLFILPTLSLPFVLVVEEIVNAPRKAAHRLGLVACSVVMLASLWCQILVNLLPFMAFYDVRGPLERDPGLKPVIEEYFSNNFALVNRDLLILHEFDEPPPFLDGVSRRWPENRTAAYVDYVKRVAGTSNCYWLRHWHEASR